ncbi:hypothetical protein DSO57_1020006 [Entomophthora muscae]|uniref:Uncharacterized protein n=1 Tax=Entomophthora muscae TaxID=34485 RepID=A0ACC2TEU6_9FUNG|nr:hypothetical protein DSO57_1020006 [Entomophthora muscae]
MTLPLTLQPNRLIEPSTATETTSTQLFGVLYITLTGLVDSMMSNSGPWSLLGQSASYIIKLVPILWWKLPTDPVVPRPESPNASFYTWLPDTDTYFTPAITEQTSAATKQIHTATTQKPATTKLLPTANAQTPAAIEQMHTATAQASATLASPT